MKTKQIRKKFFPAYHVWGNAEFPVGEAKFQWGDANYQLGDASFLLFKYWLYFHARVMALFHYYETVKKRNQHQMLTFKTSNDIRYFFKKILFSNYHQKLNKIQYR